MLLIFYRNVFHFVFYNLQESIPRCGSTESDTSAMVSSLTKDISKSASGSSLLMKSAEGSPLSTPSTPMMVRQLNFFLFFLLMVKINSSIFAILSLLGNWTTSPRIGPGSSHSLCSRVGRPRRSTPESHAFRRR